MAGTALETTCLEHQYLCTEPIDELQDHCEDRAGTGIACLAPNMYMSTEPM